MANGDSKKDHVLSMRLSEAETVLIDRAADLRGQSRTDFVREAAVRAAEEILVESAVNRMSPRGLGALTSAITAAAAAVPEMIEVLRREPPWESGCGTT